MTRCLLAALPLLAAGCFLLPDPASTSGITVKGTVGDAFSRAPLPFVEVCIIEGGSQCVDTNPSGEFFLLNVEKGTELLIRFIRNTYYPNVAHFTVTDDSERLTYLLTSDELTDLASSLANVTRDDSKGAIVFAARDGKGPTAQNITDVAVTLEPAGGQGPFYAVMGGFDMSRTSTTSVGGGVIFNVEPGDYVVRYSHPTKVCKPYYGWKGPEDGTLRVKVLSGFSTYISQICQDP